MLRPSLLLSVLGLSLASFTFACSGASTDNSDVETSKLAVQKRKDGRPTGDGKTCSWGGDTSVSPPSTPSTPPSPGAAGGSSGGCATDEQGTYRCWSYDENGEEKPIGSGSSTSSTGGAGGSSTSSTGGAGGSSGWSSSSGGSSGSSGGSSGWSSSSGGSSGSSGGCATDEQGNYRCWSYPSEPEPTPAPSPPSPTYQLGDWFPSIDGCNRCTCTDIGIMCTVQACEAPEEPPPPPSKGCEVNGRWFAAGESVPSGDCNTCSCGPDGFVGCTTMGCADPVAPSPPKAQR